VRTGVLEVETGGDADDVAGARAGAEWRRGVLEVGGVLEVAGGVLEVGGAGIRSGDGGLEVGGSGVWKDLEWLVGFLVGLVGFRST
jgi:hypothetical protein